MYELMGRTILVTGASSGIGEAMARLFAREGARVILAARRIERLQTLAEELRLLHDAQVLPFELDVADRAQTEGLMQNLPAGWRILDALVNNAGLSRGLSAFHEGSLDDWDEMVRTNVTGLLQVTRAVLPGMLVHGRGDIVNLGSISSHEVYPGGAVYCATKHAVDAVTRGLRMDLVGTPVRVSQISPGMVETEFSLVRFHGDAEKAEAVYRGLQPLTAYDVAEAALFVLSRPAHVQVGEIVLWPKAQASAVLSHREEHEDAATTIARERLESSRGGVYELDEDSWRHSPGGWDPPPGGTPSSSGIG